MTHEGTMTVDECARTLDVAPQTVRIGMQDGTLPFGAVVGRGKRKTYIIPRQAVERFMTGRSYDEQVAT